MAPAVQPTAGMQELARPAGRVAARAQPRGPSWGIVDVILAILMLPFGIWMFVIDRMVAAIAAVFSR